MKLPKIRIPATLLDAARAYVVPALVGMVAARLHSTVQKTADKVLRKIG